MLFELFDFRINLFNENADDVVTLDRRRIRDTYIDNLKAMIVSETEIMCKDIIDNYLDNPGLLKNKEKNTMEIVFLLFYLSTYFDYRLQEVITKFSDDLSQIKVCNYYGITEVHKTIPLFDILNNSFLFVSKIQKETKGQKQILNSVDDCILDDLWDRVKRPISIDSNNVLLLDIQKDNQTKGIGKHIFNYLLEEEFYSEIDSQRYRVFKAVIKKGTTFPNVAKRDDLFVYRDFVFDILSGARTILVQNGFEELSTPVANGIHSRFGGYKEEKRIEIKLDEAIRKQISDELQDKLFIENAVSRYSEPIFQSETFKNNIEFIINYKCLKNRKDVEKKYKSLFINLLKLLEREDYSEYLRNLIPLVDDDRYFRRAWEDPLAFRSNHYSLSRF